MSRSVSDCERLRELLIDEALEGLSEGEARELRELLPEGAEPDSSYSHTAAAVALSMLAPEPLPAHLTAELLRAGVERRSQVDHLVPALPLTPPDLPAVPPQPRPPRRRPSVAWLAAAVGLGLAVTSLVLRPPPRVIEVVGPPPSPPPPAAARAELLRTARDVVTLPWTRTQDPAGQTVTGDVVWSNAAQRGYMRFRGLPRNDKAALQYQLWIFDKKRDQRYPVDGGVFDSSGDEIIVPITAKILIHAPTLFAVTVEKPSGVVVSQRERIVVTAAVKSG